MEVGSEPVKTGSAPFHKTFEYFFTENDILAYSDALLKGHSVRSAGMKFTYANEKKFC